jgi:glycosyltransferase involved in cell wall biosynthesis
MPKVSVIVPNFNHARFLRQRIDSILGQTFQDFELILLDDCSTDDSRTILSSYAADPRVRVEFNAANSGSPFKQWNKGVRLARGEYVWIAESDDYADPRFLARLLPVLEASAKIGYVYCRSWCVSESGVVDRFADFYLTHIDPQRWTADYCADGVEECRNYFAWITPIANASAVVFRKAVYERVGGADESLRLTGDWKLWASVALTGQVTYVAEPLNYFRSHSATVRNKTAENCVDVLEYLAVSRWILERVTPTDAVLEKICDWQSGRWVPTVMSLRVPLALKWKILQQVRAFDPHPVRRALRPAWNTVRLKFLRHWHALRPARDTGLR